MPNAQSILCADDDRVRVSRLIFADGAETGHHRHAHDYLVVPVTGGTFRVEEADGSTRELTQVAGEPYRGAAGTEHNVVNVSGAAVSFVEVEFKR